MLWDAADSSGDEQQDGEQTEPEQVREEKKRIKPERVVVVVAKAEADEEQTEIRPESLTGSDADLSEALENVLKLGSSSEMSTDEAFREGEEMQRDISERRRNQKPFVQWGLEKIAAGQQEQEQEERLDEQEQDRIFNTLDREAALTERQAEDADRGDNRTTVHAEGTMVTEINSLMEQLDATKEESRDRQGQITSLKCLNRQDKREIRSLQGQVKDLEQELETGIEQQGRQEDVLREQIRKLRGEVLDYINNIFVHLYKLRN